MYLTQVQAEEALIAARTTYSYSHGHGPIAVYQCDDCGYFHLTSKGEVNPKLAASVQSGKIKRQQEADHWLNKMKKK